MAGDSGKKKIKRAKTNRGKVVSPRPFKPKFVYADTPDEPLNTRFILYWNIDESGERLLVEKDLEDKQSQNLAKKILDRVLSELNNEEGLVIRMRYPRTDDEEPKKPSEIAAILGIPEKKVYNMISKALSKCKEMILEEGLSIDDLINA